MALENLTFERPMSEGFRREYESGIQRSLSLNQGLMFPLSDLLGEYTGGSGGRHQVKMGKPS